jgi:hypothetical protein
MADASQELLRRIHLRFDKVDHAIGELRADNLSIRNQIYNMQGDINGLRASVGHIEDRLDRIETRLELREMSERNRTPFDPAS